MVNVGDNVAVAPLYGQKDNLVIVGVGGTVSEGNYNTYTSLGTITIPDLQDDEQGFLVDCCNEILYIAYYMGWPLPVEDRSSYLATYQLPSLTQIQNEKNDASLQYNQSSGVGHGLCLGATSFMTASIGGVYVIQGNNAYDGIIVNKMGLELITVSTVYPETFYISSDGKYIIVGEANSPYRIEVIQGSSI